MKSRSQRVALWRGADAKNKRRSCLASGPSLVRALRARNEAKTRTTVLADSERQLHVRYRAFIHRSRDGLRHTSVTIGLGRRAHRHSLMFCMMLTPPVRLLRMDQPPQRNAQRRYEWARADIEFECRQLSICGHRAGARSLRVLLLAVATRYKRRRPPGSSEAALRAVCAVDESDRLGAAGILAYQCGH